MFRRILVATAVLLLGAACSRTTVTPPAAKEEPAGLVVTGVGRIEVRPDVLVMNVGVSVEADSAPAALDLVSRRARAMLQAITGEGVGEHDVRTTSLQVRPQRSEEGAVIGFSASEMFRVRIKDLATAGDVVAAAISAGGDATRIQGMQLDISDPEAAAEQARQRAVEDALGRAEQLAKTAGVDLGPPVAITEARVEEFQAFELPVAADLAGVAEAAAVAPRIETGTQPVTVRVDVRFQILED